ncbi:MAG: NUDIX domain-containing protein [Candidatus Rokubacteria bacterium]|nr:NUDIX domain-containing protein [Candidatus Rokubacteria bacterium]
MTDLPLFLVSAGVYLDRRGTILILERAAGAMVGFWSMPSGLLDAGETPEQAAHRELREETGLHARGPLTLVGVTSLHVYGHDAVRLVYAGAAGDGEVRLSHEHSAFAWIDPLEYRRTHLGDEAIARWRARDPKEATIVEAVRATFDDYLAWRARGEETSRR